MLTLTEAGEKRIESAEYCGYTVGSSDSFGLSSANNSPRAEHPQTATRICCGLQALLLWPHHHRRRVRTDKVCTRVLLAKAYVGNDGVNDLRHRPVATSQNGRVNVYKKSRGVRAGNKRFPGTHKGLDLAPHVLIGCGAAFTCISSRTPGFESLYFHQRPSLAPIGPIA